MSTDQEWALSLVGRDWEIFWDGGEANEGEKTDSKNAVDCGVSAPVCVSQAKPSDGNNNAELLGNVNRHLPPLLPGEYDTIVPTTPSGLLMNVMADNEFVAFTRYKSLPDGSKGPAESNRCIRNVGDRFVAVNGVSVAGKTFLEVVTMLKESYKNDYAVLRLRDFRSYGDDDVNINDTTETENAPRTQSLSIDNSSIARELISNARNRHVDDGAGDNSSEGDVIDWYDGRIVSCTFTDQGHVFDVQFVGEGQIYSMNLNRALVRRSARAWLMRTKALLASRDVEQWEDVLPPDIATLEDQPHLHYLKQNILRKESPLNSDGTSGIESFVVSFQSDSKTYAFRSVSAVSSNKASSDRGSR